MKKYDITYIGNIAKYGKKTFKINLIDTESGSYLKLMGEKLDSTGELSRDTETYYGRQFEKYMSNKNTDKIVKEIVRITHDCEEDTSVIFIRAFSSMGIDEIELDSISKDILDIIKRCLYIKSKCIVLVYPILNQDIIDRDNKLEYIMYGKS